MIVFLCRGENFIKFKDNGEKKCTMKRDRFLRRKNAIYLK